MHSRNRILSARLDLRTTSGPDVALPVFSFRPGSPRLPLRRPPPSRRPPLAQPLDASNPSRHTQPLRAGLQIFPAYTRLPTQRAIQHPFIHSAGRSKNTRLPSPYPPYSPIHPVSCCSRPSSHTCLNAHPPPHAHWAVAILLTVLGPVLVSFSLFNAQVRYRARAGPAPPPIVALESGSPVPMWSGHTLPAPFPCRACGLPVPERLSLRQTSSGPST
ncbi:hypothetical protein B0T11DRAFT_145729 [Plectosphaerella cucumerina]|uniref:Uncharacterized protein n=1 Tax=Plectosphaerella cucumerina TaxID=40658 RepID=A0A8K0WZG3_9PEZI|nr:hypothetical protein B0T11DRAFT_145729 [Plectosphaerella cucumerina]